MQSFVFALRLEQLRSSALVLRLQAHGARKRTVAESVLSLRTLGPQESEHWLVLKAASKSPVRIHRSAFPLIPELFYPSKCFTASATITLRFLSTETCSFLNDSHFR